MEKELYEKLFAKTVRKMVFDRLGTLRKQLFDEIAKDLTEKEKMVLAESLVGMTEQACKDFIVEMRQRIENKKKSS